MRLPARLLAATLSAALVTADSVSAQRAAIAPAPPMAGDLAIVNARVWTGDVSRPWVDAVLVKGDRIEAVGSSAEIRKRAAGARVIDAKGRMVTPGFIDAHVHFLDGGFALSSVKLRDATTKAEFIRRIKAFATTVPKGAWIFHGDSDDTNWGGELPQPSWIDSVTPDTPVWIKRLDGHIQLGNSLTLTAPGTTRETKNVTVAPTARHGHA